MTDRPALGVIALSDSFHRLWDEIGEELGVEVTRLEPEAPLPIGLLALVVSAGGEEDRALDLLPSLERREDHPRYLVGSNPSHRFAVEALRRGATDYFAFPADVDLLRRTLAARAEALAGRDAGPRDGPAETDPFATLQGRSTALHGALEVGRRIARHGTVTVLIQGETGTGKELLARALHEAGPRREGPFVAVNCAAIPHELLESELFGHERGAFTDAHAAKPGLFEEAHRGTLFLDEIGHLPLALQGKLLRAVDDRRIRRVGGTQSREVDVRIVAATHVDLAQAVAAGEFREDLYYRLNVVTLTLPPLRDRGEDVEHLAAHFVGRFAARYKLPAPLLTDDTRRALRAYHWPGNVRELQHAVERALLLSEPGTLDPAHLAPPAVRSVETGARGAIPFPASLREILGAAVRAALLQHDGNKTAAARALGISRARLQRLLDRGED